MQSRSSESVKNRSSSSCGALLFDEESDLAADGRQHRQQVFVGLANLAAEEFHHADRLGAADDRKPERRVQARRDSANDERGKFASWTTSGIHAGARLAQTRPGRPMPDANVLTLLAAANSSNGDDAACHTPTRSENGCGAVDAPERTVFPIQCFADRLEHPRRRVSERRRFDEGTRGLIQHALIGSRAMLRIAERGRLRHQYLRR